MRLAGLLAGRLAAVLAEATILAVASSAAPAPGADPWALLSATRDELSRLSPLAARFTQTFVPSGFGSGDSESGALYVDLPRCLRFEYLEPFPKNFLLCGDWVYTWNPGEPSGRRFLSGDGEADSLDLLRLNVTALRMRYEATAATADGQRALIRLVPLDRDSEIRSAEIELGPVPAATGSAARALDALSYKDRSGNRTRFEITAYRSLGERAVFEPPPLEWLQD